MTTTTREKKQIHEIGKTTSRLLTDSEGSALTLETRYPDNDGPSDVPGLPGDQAGSLLRFVERKAPLSSKLTALCTRSETRSPS